MKRSVQMYLNGGCMDGPATIPSIFEDAMEALRDHIHYEGGLTDKAKTRQGKSNRKVAITLTIEEIK